MCYTVTFGRSIAYRQPVGSLILDRVWATLSLVALSTVIAILLTVPLAMIAALNKDG